MANELITKLNALATSINNKAGTTGKMTLDVMKERVDALTIGNSEDPMLNVYSKSELYGSPPAYKQMVNRFYFNTSLTDEEILEILNFLNNMVGMFYAVSTYDMSSFLGIALVGETINNVYTIKNLSFMVESTTPIQTIIYATVDGESEAGFVGWNPDILADGYLDIIYPGYPESYMCLAETSLATDGLFMDLYMNITLNKFTNFISTTPFTQFNGGISQMITDSGAETDSIPLLTSYHFSPIKITKNARYDLGLNFAIGFNDIPSVIDVDVQNGEAIEVTELPIPSVSNSGNIYKYNNEYYIVTQFGDKYPAIILEENGYKFTAYKDIPLSVFVYGGWFTSVASATNYKNSSSGGYTYIYYFEAEYTIGVFEDDVLQTLPLAGVVSSIDEITSTTTSGTSVYILRGVCEFSLKKLVTYLETDTVPSGVSEKCLVKMTSENESPYYISELSPWFYILYSSGDSPKLIDVRDALTTELGESVSLTEILNIYFPLSNQHKWVDREPDLADMIKADEEGQSAVWYVLKDGTNAWMAIKESNGDEGKIDFNSAITGIAGSSLPLNGKIDSIEQAELGYFYVMYNTSNFYGLYPLYLDNGDYTLNKFHEEIISGSLTSVTIPETITSLRSGVFWGCQITDINIPGNITYIAPRAFYQCFQLVNVVLNEGLKTISTEAFASCRATSISIPSTVESIREYAFANNTKLSTVVFNTSCPVTQLYNNTFVGCTSLTSIVLPNSLTTLDYYCFKGCTSLVEIVIPSGFTTFNGEVFNGCTSLTTIDMSNVTSIPTVASYTFNGCTALATIKVPSSLLEGFKAATNWSKYADIIIAGD